LIPAAQDSSVAGNGRPKRAKLTYYPMTVRLEVE
jgi:hypothetical protein